MSVDVNEGATANPAFATTVSSVSSNINDPTRTDDATMPTGATATDSGVDVDTDTLKLTVTAVTKKRRIKHNHAAQDARKSQRRRLLAEQDSAPPGAGNGFQQSATQRNVGHSRTTGSVSGFGEAAAGLSWL